jgi:sodium/hydrogen antiporter
VNWTLATLALALLAFAAITGRVDGTPVTSAMVFVAVGLLVGPEALGLVELSSHGEPVKLLAEATLTVVLFADASRIDLRVLRREIDIPARLLGIGLPLTLVAGLVVAVALFADLAWPEALLLAVVLAPTDAALGQAVVTLPRLPSRIRQGLNVESGLNDGICVPIFFIVLAVAEAEAGAIGDGAALRLVAEQIGYGVVAGVVAGAAAALAVRAVLGSRTVDAAWLQIAPLAGAALAYGIAAPIGGSGFIAAFAGGMVFGALLRGRSHEVVHLLEEGGAALGAVTFVVFGAVLLGPALGHLTTAIVVYAVASLTLVRIVPVAIALLGTGARRPTVGFLGWFGPRGLASIVFAILLEEGSDLPHEETILLTVFVTVGLSVLLHGLTAAPLAERYARWFEAHPRDSRPQLEAHPAPEVRWRNSREAP